MVLSVAPAVWRIETALKTIVSREKRVINDDIRSIDVQISLSRRISLSPFQPPNIIPDLPDLTTLSHYLSFSSKSLNHSVRPFRPLRQHLHPSLSFLASPFPSIVLCFYPHPVSILMFPFSLCTPFLSIILRFCPYTISIRPFTISGRPVSWTVFQLWHTLLLIKLLYSDRLHLATSPYIPVPFLYINS